MTNAMKIATWQKAGGVWVNPYVTDGLVAMWDGEWNAGGGVHDANATAWKDLVGTDDFLVDSGGIWNDKSISNGSTFNRIAYRDDFSFAAPITQEIVFKWNRNQFRNGVILHISQWHSGYSMLRGVHSYGDDNQFKLKTASPNSGIPRSTDILSISSLYGDSGVTTAYVNGSAVTLYGAPDDWYYNDATGVNIGNRIGNNRGTQMELFSLRLYSRALTAAEIAANYAVDAERFNLSA